MQLSRSVVLVAAALAAVAVSFLLTSPLPQDPAYHRFMDTRDLFGVANFWNVVSNLPFAVVGSIGLTYVHRHADTVCVQGLKAAYSVFFVGVFLTAFGSSYYHLEPSNETLVWDRLPMTIAFAGLFSIIVGEFVSARTAQRLLLPLLIVGLGSVQYWAWTEARGLGDLRPYAIVQFLPMLLIPLILLSRRSPYGQTHLFWWMLVFYVAAKFLEYYDAAIFSAGNIMSGHSLKHLSAALTPAVFLLALVRRRPGKRA